MPVAINMLCILFSLMQLYIPLKPRSWHIARPIYITNSTECDVVIFGGNVHIAGHLGDRDNTADLRILSCGMSCHTPCGYGEVCGGRCGCMIVVSSYPWPVY